MSTNQIYIQSRARLTAQFKKDGVLFNPQVILFSMWF